MEVSLICEARQRAHSYVGSRERFFHLSGTQLQSCALNFMAYFCGVSLLILCMCVNYTKNAIKDKLLK